MWCWKRAKRWDDDGLTAEPPGKRSSMGREQNVNWRAICGTNFKFQSIGFDLVGWNCPHHRWKYSKQNKTQDTNCPEASQFFFHIDNGATVCHRWRSIKTTSPWSEDGRLTGGTPWSCCCHASIKSVASRRYLISLLSRSGTSLSDPELLLWRAHWWFSLYALCERSCTAVTDFPEGAAQFCTR